MRMSKAEIYTVWASYLQPVSDSMLPALSSSLFNFEAQHLKPAPVPPVDIPGPQYHHRHCFYMPHESVEPTGTISAGRSAGSAGSPVPVASFSCPCCAW